jgi:tetratricopeptide (TPR) repeat protein
MMWAAVLSIAFALQNEPTVVFEKAQFFEGDKGKQDPKDDMFKTTFNKTTTRYVYTMVTLKNLKHNMGQNAVKVTLKYMRPDTTTFGEPVIDYTIPSDWKSAELWKGYGWAEPGNWEPGNWKVELWCQGKKIGEAFFSINDDRPENEKKADAFFKEGERLYVKKEYSLALKEYDRALEQNSKHADALLGKSDCHYELREYKEAVDGYTKYLTLRPSSSTAYNQRGRAKTELNDQDGAIQDYTKAIEIKPTDHVFYNNRGYAYFLKGDHAKALAEYQRSIEISPTYRRAYWNRATLYGKKDDFENAVRDWNTIVELTPKDSEAWAQRASTLHYLGRLDEAAASAKKAIDLDSAYSWPHSLLGYIAFDQRDYALAIRSFEKSAELGSDSEYYHIRIWIAKRRLGNKDQATKELADYLKDNVTREWPGKIGAFLTGSIGEAELLKAATSSEQKCEAYFYAGVVRRLSGDQEGAEKLFRDCLDTGVKSFTEYTSAQFELKNKAGASRKPTGGAAAAGGADEPDRK